MPQQKNRKIRKRSMLYAPLSFLLVCIVLMLGFSVFFRVAEIEVLGAGYYTAEEILEASGIEKGDNLFFINRSAVSSRIYARLPYAENVKVSRNLPNRVTLELTESLAVACVATEDGIWAIDRNCKLLNEVEGDALDGLIRVDGLVPLEPEAGEILAPEESETPKVKYLTEILTQVVRLDLRGRISYIDINGISNPSFDYLGRFTVKLGTNENVEYKFQCLLSAVEALNEGDRGTLDLSIDKRVHLTYD